MYVLCASFLSRASDCMILKYIYIAMVSVHMNDPAVKYTAKAACVMQAVFINELGLGSLWITGMCIIASFVSP